MSSISTPPTILVIDDDQNNLDIIGLDLEDEEYTILTASDGLKGWAVLQENKASVETILLDRAMPNMNGMEFMERLTADPEVSNIPVVMQTASGERAQVIEGINAGVYYYLTKPYEQDMLVSVVGAAIRLFAERRALRSEAERTKKLSPFLRDGYYELTKMADTSVLAQDLANLFPEPQRAVLGLSELLTNAVEHGNLGITYEDKSRLIKENTLVEELERRESLAENMAKRVRVHVHCAPEELSVRIKDEGPGFEWAKYLAIDPNRATHAHGRGIAFAQMSGFDSVEFIGCGSEVVCRMGIDDSTD